MTVSISTEPPGYVLKFSDAKNTNRYRGKVGSGLFIKLRRMIVIIRRFRRRIEKSDENRTGAFDRLYSQSKESRTRKDYSSNGNTMGIVRVSRVVVYSVRRGNGRQFSEWKRVVVSFS